MNSAGQGGVATAITATIVTFLINYLELDQKSPYWWLFYLLLIPVVYFYWRAWREAASAQKKFDDLIRQTGGQDLETWVDFHLDQIAAYGTRLKMIADAAKGNEELYKSNRIEKAQYVRDKKLCEKIEKYCVEELDRFENANEELYPKRRSKKEYDEVKDRLQVARLGT